MAQRIITEYIDDMDGTEIKQGKGGPVVFGFDGADYVIDLSDKNRKELEKALTPFLNNAKPYKSGKKVGRKSPAKSDAAAIRAWARENGFDVPDRGRVSAEVREAYAQAQ